MKILFKKLFRKLTSAKHDNFEIEITESWSKYDYGNSIGKKGSEDGKIVEDHEHFNGARITLEANAGKIPYVITFGIYGLMVHTEFFNDSESAVDYFKRKKSEIDYFLKMFDVPESNQDYNWQSKKNDYLEKLVYE